MKNIAPRLVAALIGLGPILENNGIATNVGGTDKIQTGPISPAARLIELGARRDRILVRFKSGQIPDGEARPLGKVIRRYSGVEGLELIQLNAGVLASEALRKYRADARVRYAQPDVGNKRQSLPNDPLLTSTWHLKNPGPGVLLGMLGKLGADIRAEEAWKIRNAAPNAVVAVLDSGIRATHEDLAQNMWRNPGEVPGDGLDNDGNGIVDDVYGADFSRGGGSDFPGQHGTMVAGLIGATGNNGKGIAGVCWGGVKLMSVIIAADEEDAEAWDSDILAGMEYARNQGAQILNCSFGTYRQASPAMQDEIQSLKTSGVLVVVAAGNESLDNDFDRDLGIYPAKFRSENLVTVASSSPSDQLSVFSNYGGSSVGLVAPGESLVVAAADTNWAYIPGSGTSFSAPLVAGALALMKAQLPGLSSLQLVERLLNTVDPLPELSGKCLSAGRLNLQRALSGDPAPAPYNARFVRRLPLSGAPFSGSGVTLNCPSDSPQSLENGDEPKKALWWSWVAPSDGKVRIALSAGAGPDSGYPDFEAYVLSAQSAKYRRLGGSSGVAEVDFEFLKGQEVVFRVSRKPGEGGAVGFRGRYLGEVDGYGQRAFVSVRSKGEGTAQPIGDSWKKVGETLQLQARPAEGYILHGWVRTNAPTSEEELISIEPTFQYKLKEPDYIQIEARFIRDPYAALKASYNGMATSADGAEAAYLKFDLGAAGVFSASLRVRGIVYRFTGTLRSDQAYQFEKVVAGQKVLLGLNVTNYGQVFGKLSVNDEPDWELFAERCNFDASLNPCVSAGTYTLELPVAAGTQGVAPSHPGGTGVGTASITVNGAVLFAGNLGDGLAVTQTTNLLRSGRWPFYASTYTAASSVFGWVNFDEDADFTDLTGELRWVKPARARDAMYPNGFATLMALSGARYFPPSPNEAVLVISGETNPNNWGINFSGGGLAQTLSSPLTLKRGQFMSVPPSVKLDVIRRTGVFSGSFSEAAGLPARRFRGIIQQKRGVGVGYFLRPPNSGKVEIRTAPLISPE